MNRAQRRQAARSMRAVGPDGTVTRLRPQRVTKSGYGSGTDPVSRLPRPFDPGPAGAAQPDFERAKRRRALADSIPERLRDTPEAKLMLSRVEMSWKVPVSPAQAQRWQREWATYVDSQPEARKQHAQEAGLWTPR